MNSNTDKDRYFRTSSFYTSAFLFSKGLELIDIDRTDPKCSQFIFLDTPEREILIHSFSFGKEDSPEVLVDSRKFIAAIKTLKDRLYQEGATYSPPERWSRLRWSRFIIYLFMSQKSFELKYA